MNQSNTNITWTNVLSIILIATLLGLLIHPVLGIGILLLGALDEEQKSTRRAQPTPVRVVESEGHLGDDQQANSKGDLS